MEDSLVDSFVEGGTVVVVVVDDDDDDEKEEENIVADIALGSVEEGTVGEEENIALGIVEEDSREADHMDCILVGIPHLLFWTYHLVDYQSCHHHSDYHHLGPYKRSWQLPPAGSLTWLLHQKSLPPRRLHICPL